MKPYYQDNHNTLYHSDFLSNDLPDESVQCVVTSPPYWGLRKYEGDQDLIWGGDKECQHEWVEDSKKMQTGGISDKQQSNRGITGEGWQADSGFCSLCGAWRSSYGLEPTPEMYVQHTIEILREIRRVLRKDGVVFWNIGDSYAGSWGGSGSRMGGQRTKIQERFDRPGYDQNTERPPSSFIKSKRIDRGSGRWGGGNNPASGVLKPKDLCLIPSRVAIAAQDDGWWIRSMIIWDKPNSMPESVKDRPTDSHEYIIMLTKSASYYWDQEAVREPLSPATLPRMLRGVDEGNKWENGVPGQAKQGLNVPRPNAKNIKGNFDENGVSRTTVGLNLKTAEEKNNPAGRNIRTVWQFATQPYPGAHFAIYPEKLPETCIKAANTGGRKLR